MRYAISDSGTLAYIPGTSGGSAENRTLVWEKSRGKRRTAFSRSESIIRFLEYLPMGSEWLCLLRQLRRHSIWIWDIARETMTPLTFDEETDNCAPLWTLDGKRIIYTSSRESMFLGKGDIYSKAADGTGEAEKLASSPGRGLFPRSWSKDGKNLVVWLISPLGMATLD